MLCLCYIMLCYVMLNNINNFNNNDIRCYETYDEGQEFFIVTELVAGGELFDRIVAKTHYTEKEARDLVRTFLETMAYMHEAGVVHRDLKPENLLLCSGKYVIHYVLF